MNYKKTVCVVVGLVVVWGCGATVPPAAAPSGEAEQPAAESPQESWQPSPRCRALADDLVAQMTVAEKAGQMTQVALRYVSDVEDLATYAIGAALAGGSDFPGDDLSAAGWSAVVDEWKRAALANRLHIPLLFGIDAVHGNGKVVGAVVFPHNIGLGCIQDTGLVERVFRITAQETLAMGANWAFSPVLAAPRDIRWGRTYEAFGEVPAYPASLGPVAVRGLQGAHIGETGVLACAKHFAGDGNTTFGTSPMEGAFLDRGDARLSDEELMALAVEQYAPALAAQVGSVMISYSSVNGTKMHAHKTLITDVLKGEMGFGGLVVSDWKGVDEIPGAYAEDVVTAINAGIDMVMVPDRYKEFIDIVVNAVPERIAPERIDDAVRRILGVKCALGLFDEDYSPKTPESLQQEVGSAQRRAVARQAVAASTVVLKNTGVLPLDPQTPITVVGDAADDLDRQCGGWTVTWMGQGSRTQGTTIAQAFAQQWSAPVHIDPEAAHIADESAAVVAVVGEEPYAEWYGDRADLRLTEAQQQIVNRALDSGKPVVLVLISGRPLLVTPFVERADAFVAAWLPGTEGQGVVDVLSGAVAPSGKLSFTWPKDASQIPLDALGDADPLFPRGYGLQY